METIKELNDKQKRELENLLIGARRQHTRSIADWEMKEFGNNDLYKCGKCGYISYLYPYVLHMERNHGIINYYKTINELRVCH